MGTNPGAGHRLTNVSMTREQRKLLLVDDLSTLYRHPFIVELLAYVKRMGGYCKPHCADPKCII